MKVQNVRENDFKKVFSGINNHSIFIKTKGLT